MNKPIDNQGLEREVIGGTSTNPHEGSQYTQTVEPKHLWSYAQQAALLAVSERGPDGQWRLITDPERRAKRIAGHYADLYFRSAEKSGGEVQLHWPGLAAFVVKDIVQAFRYDREEVLAGGWGNWGRTSSASQAVAEMLTEASPYEHALRVYAALAKGNLWLFMDIYPWLWFWLEYGLDRDGKLQQARLQSHVAERRTDSLQDQSRTAVRELPFGARWLGRLKARMAGDPVYAQASGFFAAPAVWSADDGGYGRHEASAYQAHRYVRQHVKDYDSGYRMPSSGYWGRFDQAYYVMEEERRELARVAGDAAALGRLERVAGFAATAEIKNAYRILIDEFGQKDPKAKTKARRDELVEIAKQEQLNILQPLIYDDAKLADTMNINHRISRYSGGTLSPPYQVIFNSRPTTNDPKLKTVFDESAGLVDWATGPKKVLPSPKDRMEYVARIAKRYNELMSESRAYMEIELREIHSWINA